MNNSDKLALLEMRFERIVEEVKKLRGAIEAGVYNPREIVGDVTLVLEGQLKQVEEIFDSSKKPPHH